MLRAGRFHVLSCGRSGTSGHGTERDRRAEEGSVEASSQGGWVGLAAGRASGHSRLSGVHGL
jgi:hypothetical protein